MTFSTLLPKMKTILLRGGTYTANKLSKLSNAYEMIGESHHPAVLPSRTILCKHKRPF